MSSVPAVSCSACHFHWNSAAMADGLRLLGACPKCGGALKFAGDHAPTEVTERFETSRPTAPHLVLGIPRR